LLEVHGTDFEEAEMIRPLVPRVPILAPALLDLATPLFAGFPSAEV